MFERPSNLALCSDAGQTSKARSGGRHFDLRPGAEDGDSLAKEAVAMDLRRRSKNRVVETIAGEADLAIGQRVRYPRTQPDHGRLFDAKPYRDRVGALETNPSDVSGKPIGVLGHDLHRVRAVGLEDPNRPGGSHPVAVKEDHDLPDDLLLGPSVRDPFGSNGADDRGDGRGSLRIADG
jgi:hypothetical protein